MVQGIVDACMPVDISDDDICEAMKDIPGYLDITPGDCREIYLKAYNHAIERLTSSVKASDVMTRDVACVLRGYSHQGCSPNYGSETCIRAACGLHRPEGYWNYIRKGLSRRHGWWTGRDLHGSGGPVPRRRSLSGSAHPSEIRKRYHDFTSHHRKRANPDSGNSQHPNH